MRDPEYNVYVVGVDKLCFWVHPVTLEPASCGSYDPYAHIDPPVEAVEVIGVGTWINRRYDKYGHV